MARATVIPQEATLNLRLDPALKSDFMAAAESEGDSAAEVLRGLMRGYVREARRRRFIAEARRQSQLIANSRDEAEVMRWMRNVSVVEKER